MQQLYYIYFSLLLKSGDQGAEGIQQMITFILALTELVLDFERQLMRIHIFFKNGHGKGKTESENPHRSISVAWCPGHTCSIQNLIKIPAQPALDHGLETRFPLPMCMFSCGCFRVVSFYEEVSDRLCFHPDTKQQFVCSPQLILT